MARSKKGRVYRRGGTLWLSFYVGEERRRQSSGFRVGQERKAQELLRRLEERVSINDYRSDVGPLTLKKFIEQRWLPERTREGLRSVKDDAARIRIHAFPRLGHLQLDEIRRRDIKDLVTGLKSGPLAARSIRHVYGLLHKAFADAVADELIDVSPCVLGKRDLPKLVDKDPNWRHQAVFSREEAERLISDPGLPLDRRVLYTLLLLTGGRVGEVSALTWADWDRAREPLGHVLICKSHDTKSGTLRPTKTEVPRHVPVHPLLARVLAAWKLSGWGKEFGRAPTEHDLIIPNVHTPGRGKRVWGPDAPRRSDVIRRTLVEDLKALGLLPRRVHDTRRTFISLCRADGAREDLLKWVTHGRPPGIMNIYSEIPWKFLCEEVAKLKLELRGAGVLELRKASSENELTHWHNLGPGGSEPVPFASRTAAGNRPQSREIVRNPPSGSLAVQSLLDSSIPAGSISFRLRIKPAARAATDLLSVARHGPPLRAAELRLPGYAQRFPPAPYSAG